MRFLSTFSGIGGLELGLERAGWECVGQVEIDASCRHWLGVHWPNVEKWNDIKALTGDIVRSRVGSIDALVGGPPCQPASVAGKRQGSADDRWLWPDFLRLGRELSPRWIVAENPTGIVTLKPHGLDWIMQELEEAGYQPFPVIVGADDVGAPHRRKRVWIVARKRLADSDEDGVREQWGCSGAESAGTDRERTWESGDAQLAHGQSGGLGADWRPPREGGHPDLGGSWPVGEPTGAGLEGLRPDSGEPQEPKPRHSSPHSWPARPGEPQHDWEAPRLAHTQGRGRASEGDGRKSGSRSGRDGEDWADGTPGPEQGSAVEPTGEGEGQSQSRMGRELDGLPSGVAGQRATYTSAHRREALKALGNAVVPQVVEIIGRAIMEMDR